jgi:transposase
MREHFRSFDRDTLFLLPPSVQDWLPDDHLARFIVEIVSKLDLRRLKSSYAGRGEAAYHPEMMVALLFYAYASGIRASRKIERATYESIAFRFLAANAHPDHDTIADFRTRFAPHLTNCFNQILVMAKDMGCLKVGRVSLDGTKIQANASKHRSLSFERASQLHARLRREAERMIELAEAADREDDDDDGMTLPAEIARREDRLAKLEEVKQRLKVRAAEEQAREQAEYEATMMEWRELRNQGQRFVNRPPQRPQARELSKTQVNLTDEESRIMPSAEGFVQGYNAQVATDCDSLLIVGEDLSQRPTDRSLLKSMLEQLCELPVGKPDGLLADAGYFSELNVNRCELAGLTPYIAIKRDRHHWGLRHWRKPKPPSANAGALERLQYRLKTQDGRAIYGLRKSTVEPVIGIIKRGMGFRQFLLRSRDKAHAEWRLACIGWNLRRLRVLSAT